MELGAMFRTLGQAASRKAFAKTAKVSITSTPLRQLANRSAPVIKSTPLFKTKFSKALKYSPVTYAAWTFANSPSFEASLEAPLKPTEPKVSVQPTIFSGSDGLISESFGPWIRALLTRVGHYDVEKAKADIEIFSAHHDAIENEIDRAHLEPETFVWCKDHLDEIFRFSNHDGMNETFEILSPVEDKLESWPTYGSNQDLFQELIKFKTFIEKERYKYFRRYEEIVEHTAEMGDSLDRMNVMLAQANPYNDQMERFTSHTLGPIYNSVYNSLLSLVDVSTIVDKPLLHVQLYDEQIQKLFDEKLGATTAQLFPADRSTWDEKQKADYQKLEYAVLSRALYMLRTQALVLNQANTVAESINQLYHELSWDFKTYYDENTVAKIMNYATKEAQLEGQERDDFFKTASPLPIPPLFNLRAAGVLNLFTQQVSLKDMVKQLQESRDADDVSELDTTRLTVVSAPVGLLMRLVNAEKQVLIPSIHHRAQVYDELQSVITRLTQRPYIVYGLQKRLKETIENPQAQEVIDVQEHYLRSAKKQSKKKKEKKSSYRSWRKRQIKKMEKGFADFDSHEYHPDHDDFRAMQHHDQELMASFQDDIKLPTV